MRGLLGSELPPAELSRLADLGPVVVVGRRLRPGIADVIRTSERDGMRQVVDHLIELGHRPSPTWTGGRAGSRPIVAVVTRRPCARGGCRTTSGTCRVVMTKPGEQQRPGRWPSEPAQPSAITAFNDHCAAGVADRLVRSRVDVPAASVVGYDDSPVSALASLDLTTVSQEPARQAQLAVQAAVDRLDGRRSHTQEVVLNPTLVVRSSTGSFIVAADRSPGRARRSPRRE